jgi:hypothetical protein
MAKTDKSPSEKARDKQLIITATLLGAGMVVLALAWNALRHFVPAASSYEQLFEAVMIVYVGVTAAVMYSRRN